MSSSGMGRGVHSLTLSIQDFLCQRRRRASVGFLFLVFPCMPVESYRRRLIFQFFVPCVSNAFNSLFVYSVPDQRIKKKL